VTGVGSSTVERSAAMYGGSTIHGGPSRLEDSSTLISGGPVESLQALAGGHRPVPRTARSLLIRVNQLTSSRKRTVANFRDRPRCRHSTAPAHRLPQGARDLEPMPAEL